MVEQKDGSFTCIADIARCSFYIVKDLGPVECSYIKDEIIEFVYGIGEIFQHLTSIYMMKQKNRLFMYR